MSSLCSLVHLYIDLCIYIEHIYSIWMVSALSLGFVFWVCQCRYSVLSLPLAHPSTSPTILSLSFSSLVLASCNQGQRPWQSAEAFSCCKSPFMILLVCVCDMCVCWLCVLCMNVCACGCIVSAVAGRLLWSALSLLTYFPSCLPTAGAKWMHQIKCQPFQSLSRYYRIPL